MKLLRPCAPAALLLLVTLVWPRAAVAWIFPEHRDIANQALAQLPPDARDV